MNAIGTAVMQQILAVTDELRSCVRDQFEPYEGVYRINDMGEYVSEEDWLNVWAGYPSWWPHAWILADNGQFTSDEVSRMGVEEIEAAYADPAFEPEYAYYTETDEEGRP